MMTNDQLTTLACPTCKGPLTPNDSQDMLRCEICRIDYPVRDGIPVLLEGDERDPSRS